jgi:hypothetical protein
MQHISYTGKKANIHFMGLELSEFLPESRDVEPLF